MKTSLPVMLLGAALISMTVCPSASAASRPKPPTVRNLQKQITVLKGEVGQLEGKLARLHLVLGGAQFVQPQSGRDVGVSVPCPANSVAIGLYLGQVPNGPYTFAPQCAPVSVGP